MKLLRSQCAFLLGDVTLHVFNRKDEAKRFYEQALREFPEHDGALTALARLILPVIPPQAAPQHQDGGSANQGNPSTQSP